MLQDNGQFGGGWGCRGALTAIFKREEAFDVWSRSDVGKLAVEEWEVVVVVGLSLLKTSPSAESSSDSISTTLLSRGGGAGDGWAAARGTATIGVERTQ